MLSSLLIASYRAGPSITFLVVCWVFLFCLRCLVLFLCVCFVASGFVFGFLCFVEES